jgi:hypothetical protein
MHDISIEVERGDEVDFVAERTDRRYKEKVMWDPVITYEEK